MAFQEHDDAAYAADVEGPAPSASSSPTASSFRRPRSVRRHDVGLYASRLRQNHPPTKQTKHDDAAPGVEPLRFVAGGHAAANGSHQHAHTQASTSSTASSTASSKTAAARPPLLLGSPKAAAAAHRNKFDFDDSFDEGLDDGNSRGSDAAAPTAASTATAPAALPAATSLPQSPSPSSPASPRWASPVDSTTVSSYSFSSSAATTSAPPFSVHTSLTSVAFSTAPTSPISPTPSYASVSAPRFAGLSSHPFVVASPVPHPVAEDAPSPTEKRGERSPFPAVSPLPPAPPPPPRSDLRTPTPPLGGAMIVGNFSRPRQPSIKQGARDLFPATALRLRQPEPLQLESPAQTAAAPAQERARGLSTSSNKSSAYSSASHRPSNDSLRATHLPPLSSTRNADSTSPDLRRPPLAYSRTESSESSNFGAPSSNGGTLPFPAQSRPQQRDPFLAAAEEESRSSYRSQVTDSTAPKTIFTNSGTARSSVLSKASSRASMSWFTNAPPGADDDLSVDDVMGLYEKGFGDSTGAEDTDGPYGGGGGDTMTQDSADEDLSDGEPLDGSRTPSGHAHDAAGSGVIRSQILDAMGAPLAVPSRATHQADAADAADDMALDTPRPVRFSGLSSSAPNESVFGLAMQQHLASRQLSVPKGGDPDETKEKRDSAKMLEADDSAPDRLSPVPSPSPQPASAAAGSRPSSVKAPSLFARAQNEPDDPSLRDRYGFRKHNQYITREQYDAWNGPYTEYMGRRRRKWVAYLRDSGLITDKPTRFPPPSVKTKRFIRKGIPPEWRGAAWFYYAGGPSIVAKHPGIYNQLIARAARGEAKDVDIETIERDLHRTFPDNVAFKFSGDQQPGHGDHSQLSDDAKAKSNITADRPDEPKIVSKLRRVLLAFSIYNPRIGYCQSLNFLAGLLLLFVETEEHCFWLLNVITRIFLPGTHDLSLEGSKVDVSVLMATLQESLPSVWAKIGGELEDGALSGQSSHAHRDAPKHGTIGRKMKLPRVGGGGRGAEASVLTSVDRLPPITVCMMAWFMSCFIGTLPIETTLRVWDIFFYEGSKTLFRVALAIFKLGETEIRAVADPMEIFGVVQELPRRLLDCNMLMETTFRRRNGFGHLSQENIDEKRRECRAAFKGARTAAAATAAAAGDHASASGEHAGHDDEAASGAAVHRKGTLFGRHRDRRPGEVA